MTERGSRKTREGFVVSDKMDKTVVVELTRTLKHPLYDRVIRRSSRVKAHDEKNDCRLSDRVLIVETRPLSKDKSWRVLEILERAR